MKEEQPKDGDNVVAKSPSGWWTEEWDANEPIGHTTHWKLIPLKGN